MTKHSIRRARERAGINKTAAAKMFERAFIYGKTAGDMPTRERRYMEERTEAQKLVTYYNGFCFFFSNDGICITMYHAPEWFCKSTNYDGKITVKNPKKYFSKYVREEEYESER